MTAESSDFLYTVALVTVGLLLVWVLIKLVETLFKRVQADHYAATFGEDFLLGRDPHRRDVRRAMQKARR
jgi:hypothetical protein